MSNANFSLLNQVNEAVEEGLLEDMTETTSGGGRGLLPAGEAFVRISMYVEFGVQKLPAFKGKAKAPHLTFKLGAYIVGGGGVNKDGEDEDYVVEEGQFPFISTFETPLYRNEKAKATKWFNALNQKGQYTSMAQALGGLYIVPIKIDKSRKDPTKLINIIEWDKARLAIDPASRKPYVLPELAVDKYKLLLWNKPSKEQWDSIYQEGFWEAKDGKPAESKNKLQERCRQATNFIGSPLQQLLDELGEDATVLPDLVDDSTGVPDVDEGDDVPDSEATTPAIPDVPDVD